MKKDSVFDSTLSSRNVVPHPSGMIYEKRQHFDSTLSSRNVVPHPSNMIYEKSRHFWQDLKLPEGGLPPQ